MFSWCLKLIGNFLIYDFGRPQKLDRDSKGGGIMSHIREDIPLNFPPTDKKPI